MQYDQYTVAVEGDLRGRLHQHVTSTDKHVDVPWKSIRAMPVECWSADWQDEYTMPVLSVEDEDYHEPVHRWKIYDKNHGGNYITRNLIA